MIPIALSVRIWIATGHTTQPSGDHRMVTHHLTNHLPDDSLQGMAKYTKPESEQIVRRLCPDWLREQPEAKRDHPSFTDFRVWLEARHPGVLSFRSNTGPLYDAEMWFDRELGQCWRN